MASLLLGAILTLICRVIGQLTQLTAPPSDADLLLERIKPSLQGDTENLLLSSWDSTQSLCSWRGLQWGFDDGSPLRCNESWLPRLSDGASHTNYSLLRVLSLRLPAAGLTGKIPREIAELPSLQSLYLAVNSLVGTIPLELGNCVSLSDVDLRQNSFTGSLPPSIWNLCDNLVYLRLHGNNLSDFLPEPAMPTLSCSKLKVLDMGNNRFQGPFPEFVLNFLGLEELDLANNEFSGRIPPGIWGLSLKRLNLSYNNFSGQLPVAAGKYRMDDFEGNSPSLCGPPLGKCRHSSGLSSGVTAGILIGLMVGVVVLASVSIGFLQGKRRQNRKTYQGGDIYEDEEEDENGDGGDGKFKFLVFQGGEQLTLEDVLNATGQVVQKTVYGNVYRAKLMDGGVITLRLLREGSCKDRASCMPVIRQLGRLRHENLVPLRAFYHGRRGERLLVYDYFPNKTLYDLLHEARAGTPMLNWRRRHKIALGIARGLAYLHTFNETPVAHGNLRSANVLVDEFFVARVAEFGLQRLLVPAVADGMMAAVKADRYKAPELHRMSKCNWRTDVFAFGILLLEILLGRKPGRDERTGEAVDLPAIVKVAVLEETTMEVFDAEVLKGTTSPMEDGLLHALKLAMGCCSPVPSVRPNMLDVVKQLEENRPRRPSTRSALFSPAERIEPPPSE